jgi:hypothetical protein
VNELRPLLDVTKTVADWAYDKPVGYTENGMTVVEAGGSTLSGFRYVVVTGPDGKVYVGFAGTNPNVGLDQIIDLLTDADQAVGGIPASYLQALETARRLKEQYGDKLVVTGHSLGGGQASYAAAMLGIRGVGFNAAPLGSGALLDIETNGADHPERYLTQVNNEHDPVSGYSPNLNYLLYLTDFGITELPMPNGDIPLQLGESLRLTDSGGFSFGNHGLGSIDLDRTNGYRPPLPLEPSLAGSLINYFGLGSR